MNNELINVIDISIEEKNNILAAEEGHCLELKSKNIRPTKLTDTLSAFANAAGGELYIGVPENKRGKKKLRVWAGFSDQEDANGHLQLFERFMYSSRRPWHDWNMYKLAIPIFFMAVWVAVLVWVITYSE